jgi:rfaE bifunctional protein nucleotidyltransferase chain/domain
VNFADKIVISADLPKRLGALPRPLVFTNGVFDLLHPGHVDYLERARSLGQSLLVGVNSDASVRLLSKGKDRPITAERDRALMLAALSSVSLVTLFSERTPIGLLSVVRPDLYVKGGDYDVEALEETLLVRSFGGDAKAINFLEGYSTTEILRRIRQTAPE